MPSIELLGYDPDEQEEIKSQLRRDLADLEFCEEIIFVSYRASVIGFKSGKQSYLRVATRNESKAEILMDRLKRYADVEYIRSADIAFKQD